MKAKNETTTFFVDKTGDKLYVELEISGDPDKAVYALMESLQTNTDLLPNIKVTEIYFRSRGIDAAIDKMKVKIKSAIRDSFDEVEAMFKPNK